MLRPRLNLLLAIAALTIAAACPSDEEEPIAGPPPTRAPGSEVTISGLVTTMHAEEATGPPLDLPLTIELPGVGSGDAVIQQAKVAGATRTIAWTGGRPLELTGEGQLDLGPATLDVDRSGVRWLVDGGPRVLLGATWSTQAPVAVGEEGVASARDGLSFEIGPDTALVSTGGAFVRRPLTDMELKGPGLVRLAGEFRLSSPDEVATDVRTVRMPEGPFTLTLEVVAGGGIQLEGVLGGRVFVNDDAGNKDSR